MFLLNILYVFRHPNKGTASFFVNLPKMPRLSQLMGPFTKLLRLLCFSQANFD